MEMPATNEGVATYPERDLALDYDQYGKRLKRFGTAIRSGEEVIVTKARAKDRLVEFQLAGGGYGTVGDDTSSGVGVPYTAKSKRKECLERDSKHETDPKKRRDMQDELSDLRSEREREQRRLQVMTAEANEHVLSHSRPGDYAVARGSMCATAASSTKATLSPER